MIGGNFEAALWQESRRSLLAHSTIMTPHQKSLIEQVVGTGGTSAGYLYGGFTTSIGLRAILRLIGRSIYDFKNVLDFGCGTARVVRWFHDAHPGTQFHGVDVNEEAVAWCKQNIAFAEFRKTEPLPPLPFAGNSLDLIYGISVLTHLDEEYQFAWLRELLRVTKPGGLVMLTVHGQAKAKTDLSAEQFGQFRDKVFFYKRAVAQGGVDGLPDFYQVAFHSWKYVELVWSGYFRILAHLKHGPLYTQELIVMEKAREGQSQTQLPHIDLPMASIDDPDFGVETREDMLGVGGWAFYPAGGTVELNLWVDGEKIGPFPASMPRPDVAKAFAFESANAPGFVKALSIRDYARGPHLVWLSEINNPVPLCATYFLKG